MKKVLLTLLSLFVLSTVCASCGDDDISIPGGGGSGSLSGIWVLEYYPGDDTADTYLQITKGELIEYQLNGYADATFKDGILYTPSGYKWEQKGKLSYKIKNGNEIWVNIDGFQGVWRRVTYISDNTLILCLDGDYDGEFKETYHRVKRIVNK